MPSSDRTETVAAVHIPRATPEILAVGTVVAGRFGVLEVLGSGGFSVVYRVRDRQLGGEVALKLLRADRLTPSSLKRLRREVAVARDAASQHLVRVYDIGGSGDTLYLTMEAVRGESLRDRMRRGALPIEEAVRVGLGVLSGLEALHELNIVHRDVKPANVLLPESGAVKLADFGLARPWDHDDTRATETAALVGTVEYLSPEQALGRPVEARSDLYSFGVVLFEMLAGRLPHQEESSLGTLLAHIQRPAPDVRELRPEVPRWLAQVVARLLERDEERRYRSVGAVRRDMTVRRLRLPRRLSRGVSLGVLAALAALALAALVWVRLAAAAFSHLAPLDRGGIQAVAGDGRTLWALEGVGGDFVTARLAPWRARAVVGIPHRERDDDAERLRTLRVYDAESGAVTARYRLPWMAPSFNELGFAETYTPVLVARDLDGDGVDEVVVSYLHQPYWPSFTVLFEPRTRRSRVLLVASGHHRLTEAVDLDGDGRRELLFVGINNRMGWNTALTALRLDPGLDEVTRSPAAGVVSWTPDREPDGNGNASLLWYALLPVDACTEPGCVTVDRAQRVIVVRRKDVGVRRLSFSGFLLDDTSPRPPSERREARKEAYRRLREGERLRRAGYPEESRLELERAVAAAREAADRTLVEWARRVLAKTLVAGARPAEAEELFSAIAAGSEHPPDVAFDAGRSLHLAGELERAVRWYRRGFGPGGNQRMGRGKWEFLQGLVLALVELGRPDEARREVRRFREVYSAAGDPRIYDAYLDWRTGGIPATPAVTATAPDLERYWALELDYRRDGASPELLATLTDERKWSSETRPLLASLESAVLADLGRTDEALARAREAFAAVAAGAAEDTGLRAHFELVTHRLAELERAHGDPEAARRAELTYGRWREGQPEARRR